MAWLRHRSDWHPGVRVAARTPRAVALAALVSAAAAWISCAPSRSVAAPPPQRVTLAVATWNMHAGRGDLSQLIHDLASGALTKGVPNDYVLLLQEDLEPSDHSARDAAMAHGLSFFLAPTRDNGPRVSANAILSTRPLLGPRVLPLERQRQPRNAISATVMLDNATLFLVNVHMENRFSWWRVLFSDSARGRQASALLDQLPTNAPGILGGDLNTWLGPRERAWRVMLERFPDTPRDTSDPTFHNRLVLDHLFFDLPEGWTAISRVISDSYGSDHHPVVAIVTAATKTN